MAKDYAQMVASMSPQKREAIMLMGENRDTLQGFEIDYGVMSELIKQELADKLDTGNYAKRPLYWLTLVGIGCHKVICNINAKAYAAGRRQEV